MIPDTLFLFSKNPIRRLAMVCTAFVPIAIRDFWRQKVGGIKHKVVIIEDKFYGFNDDFFVYVSMIISSSTCFEGSLTWPKLFLVLFFMCLTMTSGECL